MGPHVLPPPTAPPRLMGDFLDRFNGEVLFQMSLKGERVFKVEIDAIGIVGMARAQTSENTWLLEELQGAGLTCEQKAEMGAVGGLGCMDSMLLTDLSAWGLLPHGSVQLRGCSWTRGGRGLTSVRG